MGEVKYVSRVKIRRTKGPQRLAYLPAEADPVPFGVHSEIAEHYGVDPQQFEPHATTLDYVVAAAGGWLTGTLGGALEARGIDAGEGRLEAQVTGEVESDDGVLVIRRIRVKYRITAPQEAAETIDRVHAVHARSCPVYRSIHEAISIETEYERVEG